MKGLTTLLNILRVEETFTTSQLVRLKLKRMKVTWLGNIQTRRTSAMAALILVSMISTCLRLFCACVCASCCWPMMKNFRWKNVTAITKKGTNAVMVQYTTVKIWLANMFPIRGLSMQMVTGPISLEKVWKSVGIVTTKVTINNSTAYTRTLRMLNNSLYLTGLARAYQRSIAMHMAMEMEYLARSQTKKLRWIRKQNALPIPPEGTGITSLPITNDGEMMTKKPWKRKVFPINPQHLAWILQYHKIYFNYLQVLKVSI